MALPTQLFSIMLETNTTKSQINVPFVIRKSNTLLNYVKVKPYAQGQQEIELENATDRFIEHYFPEYYPLLPGSTTNNPEFTEYTDYYDTLRENIKSSLVPIDADLLPSPVEALPSMLSLLEAGRASEGDNDGSFVVYRCDLSKGQNFYDLREEYEQDEKLPSFELALEIFNQSRDTGEEVDSSSFNFQQTPSRLEELGGALNSFGDALRALQGSISTPVDAGGLETETTRVINKILDFVYESTDFKYEKKSFHDSDYVTVYFDSDSNITSIEYFTLNITQGETQTVKVGFFTNMSYNTVFLDPIIRNIIRNYDEIIENVSRPGELGEQSPLTSFLSLAGLPGGINFGLADPDIAGGLPGNNLFGGQCSDEQIDITDISALENTFSKIMSREQLLELERKIEDPEYKKQLLQDQKARKINAGIQIVDSINNVLNFNFPISGPNMTKEQRAVAALLNQFGIQSLAKEALICMTLGLGASAARITESVRDSIVNTASSLRSMPIPPSQEVNIQRPNLSGIFKDAAKFFSVTGSPPIGQQVADIILNTLANAAFEVIKSLAELLQFNCAAIWQNILGQVDVGEELMNLNNQAVAAGGLPNLAALLDQQFAQFGINADQAYAYLSDLSAILNPVEVCRLLNAQQEVENSTYNKIIGYNSSYPNIPISQNISNRGQINAFFAAASSHIDTVSVCNSIINDNIVAVVESCNICLDEDFVAPNQALADLIDIADNGITLQIPDIDFLCEDSINYIENPIAQRILPNLFNNVIDTTKIYMAGSLEAARTSLLEPTVSTKVNDDLAGAFASAGVEMEPAELDPAVMDFVTDLMNGIEGAVGLIASSTATCQDIPDEKLQVIQSNITVVLDAVRAALDELPEVIEDVNDKISVLQEQGSGPGGIPHTQYKFPTAFARKFEGSVRTPMQGEVSALFSTVGTDPDGRPRVYRHRDDSNGLGDPYTLYYASAKMYVDNLSPTRFEEHQLRTKLRQKTTFPNFITQTYKEYNNQSPDDIEALYTVDYNVPGQPLAGSLSDELIPPGVYRDFVNANNSLYNLYGMNPYLARFVGPIATDRGIDHTTTAGIEELAVITAFEHSEVNRYLLENLFHYVRREGSFSTARINNLNFFKINDSCPPESVGDLFDSAGILDQMKREFAAAACYDESSNTAKSRNALYYGLMMMSIQTALVEFIIQNIVVFTAFQMQSLMTNEILREFMVNQIIDNVINTTLDGSGIFERELFNYFERVSRRVPTILDGGITHSYDQSTVPPGYELDAETQVANYPLDNRALVRFLVEERINYTWDNGLRSTLQSVNNILDANGNIKDYQSIFIDDVLGPILNAADFGPDPIVASAEYTNMLQVPAGNIAAAFLMQWMQTGTTYERMSTGAEALDAPDPAASSNDFAWGGIWNYADDGAASIPGGLQNNAAQFLTSVSPSQQAASPSTLGPGVSTTGDYSIARSTSNNEVTVYFAILLASSPGVNPSTAALEMPDEFEVYNQVDQYLASLPGSEYDNTLLLNVVPLVKFQIQHPGQLNIGGQLIQYYGFEVTGILNTEVDFLVDPDAITSSNFLYFLRDTPTDTVSLQYARFIDQAPYFEEVTMFDVQYGPGGSWVADGFIRQAILDSDEYKQFFHQPFNMNAIFMYPILYNYYLTDRYFSDVVGSFNTVKRAILSFMEMTDNSSRPPLPSVPNNEFANSLANNGQQDMQSMARDIFLKFLKETPIMILKGLCELIDPHVAITKIIKTATGDAFNQVANAITAALPEDGPGSELTGSEILALAFCAYSVANSTASSFGNTFPDTGEGAPLFGPRITLDGIDFKGTVSGMVMAPPSPLGILYLLLEMLKHLIDQIPPSEENVDATAGSTNEC